MDEYSKEIKKATKLWFVNSGDLYCNRAMYIRDSRNASASSTNRRILLNEQGGICRGLLLPNGRYVSCNRRAVECDHIIEIRWGGRDMIDFLQMLCRSCHCKKTRLNYKRQHCY